MELFNNFSPTSSKSENLPQAVYDAENDGREKRCMDNYDRHCSIDILDFITELY